MYHKMFDERFTKRILQQKNVKSSVILSSLATHQWMNDDVYLQLPSLILIISRYFSIQFLIDFELDFELWVDLDRMKILNVFSVKSRNKSKVPKDNSDDKRSFFIYALRPEIWYTFKVYFCLNFRYIYMYNFH